MIEIPKSDGTGDPASKNEGSGACFIIRSERQLDFSLLKQARSKVSFTQAGEIYFLAREEILLPLVPIPINLCFPTKPIM
jgi:hypothetical protein